MRRPCAGVLLFSASLIFIWYGSYSLHFLDDKIKHDFISGKVNGRFLSDPLDFCQ
ncbi:Hypothetical protein EAG7_03652 [Klebsiella aerogenes]|jgi:hypothetical protein|nr:Hypothetical protein EAG7_03652 [Klebsiella aerogenes]PVF77678.1 hypothetical protein CSC18_4633 [Klebsiella aerogenes]CCG32147.1 hypothetical protein [Klebsiella aerogenes EA1509E]